MSTKSQDKKKNKDCARQWRKEKVEKFVYQKIYQKKDFV